MIHDNRDLGAFIPSYLDDYPLNATEFRIYAHIARRAGHGQCWESVQAMSKHCYMNVKTTRKALDSLIKNGLINYTERPGSSPLITLNPVSEWKPKESVNPKRSGNPTPCKTKTTPDKYDLGQKSIEPESNLVDQPRSNMSEPVRANLTNKGTPIEGTPVRYSHKGSDLRVRDFESASPEPEPTRENVPVAVPVPSPRREIQFTADPMGDRFSAGSNLPEWRTGPGLNGLRQDFVEWLAKSYLAGLPCYKDSKPTPANAKSWIVSREKRYETELIEIQWQAFSDSDRSQGVETTNPAYDWSRDPRFGEWRSAYMAMGLRFVKPDGRNRDMERNAFLIWLDEHPELMEVTA